MEQPNCTRHMMIPSSADYLTDISVGYLVVTILLGLVTTANVILYFEQIAFFLIHRQEWKPRDKAKWIIAVYPIMSATAFGALLVPRSSYIADTVTSIYVSLIVYVFVTMLIGHFGGAEKMVSQLTGTTMKFNTQPCCFCFCLPERPLTWKLLRNIQIMVLQFALARPVLAYIITVAYTDQNFGTPTVAASPSTWLGVINAASSVTAMWGLMMIFGISRVPLKDLSVKPKFLCMQLVITIGGLQKAVIGIFVVAGVIPCDGLLSRQANGDRWNHMIIIVEAMILSVVARHYYRKHVGDDPHGHTTLQVKDEDNYQSPTERLLTTPGGYGSGDSTLDSNSYAYEDRTLQNNLGRFSGQQLGGQPTRATSNSDQQSQNRPEIGHGNSVEQSKTGLVHSANDMGKNNAHNDTDALLLNIDDGSLI